MKVLLSTAQCAELFEVSVRTIQKWGELGLPQAKRNQWDLKVVFDWWDENINSSRVDQDETMVEAKRLYWREKAEGEKLRNQKTREELVPWSQVETEWAGRVSLVTSGLEAFGDRLPPILLGKDRKQMRDIIKAEVKYLRNSYARNGRYCPPPKEKTAGNG